MARERPSVILNDRWYYSAAALSGAGGCQRRIGLRAARVSSRRRRGASRGASRNDSASPAWARRASATSTSANWSRVCSSLALGGLEEQRPVYHQRKVHGHRVKPLVDQRLSVIERTDPGRIQEPVVEQYLVHARPQVGRAEHLADPGQQVIGVQHRVPRGLLEAVAAMAHHIAERPHEHAHLAVKTLQAAERLVAGARAGRDAPPARQLRRRQPPRTAAAHRAPAPPTAPSARRPARRRHAAWRRSCAG